MSEEHKHKLPGDVTMEDAEEPRESPLDKVEAIELLPNLFTLLHQLEKGELQPKDFYNHAGTIRMKLNNMKQLLTEIDGICEPVSDREAKIAKMKESNQRKVEFINAFRNRVAKDLKGKGET